MRFVLVGLLALSACSARVPVRTVPLLVSPGALFREYVQRFAVTAGVRGLVDVTFLSPGQIENNLAQAWRISSRVYAVAANIVWLAKASENGIREAAAHEVCHISLGHADGLADGLIDAELLNDAKSTWHQQVYRCEVELIGEDRFCLGFVEKGSARNAAECRAYLRKISS